MRRGVLYVSQVCGNVIRATDEVVSSSCEIALTPQKVEEDDLDHRIQTEVVEVEYLSPFSIP